MAKLLVTHINPHLDDIAAIWLFKKFHQDFTKAKVKFISTSIKGSTYLGKEVDSDPNIVHFGVGKGRFDEHKGDIKDCATSLVWKEILASGLAPKDEVEKMAYEEIVEWATLIDTGNFPDIPYGDFSIPAFIRPISGEVKESEKAQELGEAILDRVLRVLMTKYKAKKDWDSHLEFKTRWGSTVAVESEEANRAILKQFGGDKFSLYLLYRPKTKSMEFFSFAPGIDLTPLYIKLGEFDPKASWYLHHGKRMLLCGSKSSPEYNPTKLTFEQLIEAAKDV